LIYGLIIKYNLVNRKQFNKYYDLIIINIKRYIYTIKFSDINLINTKYNLNIDDINIFKSNIMIESDIYIKKRNDINIMLQKYQIM